MKLEVKKGIELEVRNYWHRDYLEDDWGIKIIADTIEEAIEDFWKNRYASSEIHINGVYFSKVKYVIYKGKKVKLEEEDFDKDLRDLYHSQFSNSPLKDTAYEQRRELLAKKKEQEYKEYEAEKEASELAKLKELQQKYPNA